MAARLRTDVLASQLTSQLAPFDVISEMLGHGNTTTKGLLCLIRSIISKDCVRGAEGRLLSIGR